MSYTFSLQVCHGFKTAPITSKLIQSKAVVNFKSTQMQTQDKLFRVSVFYNKDVQLLFPMTT